MLYGVGTYTTLPQQKRALPSSLLHFLQLFIMNFFVGEVAFKRLMLFVFERWVGFGDTCGFLSSKGGELLVFECFHNEVGYAGLTDAGEFATTTGLQVFLG